VILPLALLFFAAFAAAPPSYGVLEEIFGPPDTAIVLGNGRLTLSANGAGRITVCRWPSPGLSDQLSYRTRSRNLPQYGALPADGLFWGLRIDDNTLWLNGVTGDATASTDRAGYVFRVTTRSKDPDFTATQELLVHPEHDVFGVHIRVQSARPVQTFFWIANFCPATRVLPEWPLADWAFDSANDFAVFTTGTGTSICHFRPEDLNSRSWQQARELIRTKAESEAWRAFGEGVWIAYTSSAGAEAFQCGPDAGPASPYTQASAGKLAKDQAAVGTCSSVIAIPPTQREDDSGSSLSEATVYTAFGPTWETVSERLAAACVQGWAGLLQDARSRIAAVQAKATLPASPDPAIRAMAEGCLMTLLSAMDRETGAVVRNPTPQPPLAMHFARHAPWITLALDKAGFPELAERHVLFGAGLVRQTTQPGRPAGSVPATVYADGTEALPYPVLEVDGTAWTLWDISEHSRRLDKERRRAFLEGVWPSVQQGADFLVRWCDLRTRMPLHSFDPARWRDAQSNGLVAVTYIGISAAIEIADALGFKQEEWNERRSELRALINYHCLDGTGHWTVPGALDYWAADVARPGRPRSAPWEHLAEKALEGLDEMAPHETAKTLLNLAMLWRDEPKELARLGPYMRDAMARGSGAGAAAQADPLAPTVYPDTLNAACCLAAAITVFPDTGAMDGMPTPSS
jgi:hypothetical protein